MKLQYQLLLNTICIGLLNLYCFCLSVTVSRLLVSSSSSWLPIILVLTNLNASGHYAF